MTHNTTDRAATLRAAYKAKGWSSRDISVKSNYFSMGSSIDIRVKNAAVPLATVEAMANEHESIRRCELTGEILSGGNCYVHVSYSHEAAEVIRAQYAPALTAAAAVLADASDNSLIPVGETGYLLGRDNYSGFALWQAGRGHLQSANTPEYLALALHARLGGGR